MLIDSARKNCILRSWSSAFFFFYVLSHVTHKEPKKFLTGIKHSITVWLFVRLFFHISFFILWKIFIMYFAVVWCNWRRGSEFTFTLKGLLKFSVAIKRKQENLDSKHFDILGLLVNVKKCFDQVKYWCLIYGLSHNWKYLKPFMVVNALSL